MESRLTVSRKGTKSDPMDITEIIGESGKYQIISTLIAFYISAITGTVSLYVQFLAPNVDLLWANSTDATDTRMISDNCAFNQLMSSKPTTNNSDFEDWHLVYESKYSHRTLTEQFDLVCESSWLILFADSLIMIGALLGSYIFGQISELIGRRRVFVGLLIPCVLANLLILFSQNYAMFAIGSLLNGATSFPINNACFITVMETVSFSRRAMYGTFSKYGMIFGQLVLSACAWIFEDWFYTQISQTVFVAIAFLIAPYMLESPVWLVVKGQKDLARINLNTMIRRNGREVECEDTKISEWFQSIKSRSLTLESSEEGRLKDLFKGPKIRQYTICLSFVLFTVHFAYYGLTMNMETFGTHLYIDNMISIGLAIFSMMICTVCLYYVSVRNLTSAFNMLLVVICVLYPIFFDYPLARSVLTALARFAMTAPMSTTFVYISEVFPSSVRGVGMGFVGLFSRTGGAISPFIRELGLKTYTYVPLLLIAFLSLISSFLLYKVLPETKGRRFFHTVKELESQN